MVNNSALDGWCKKNTFLTSYIGACVLGIILIFCYRFLGEEGKSVIGQFCPFLLQGDLYSFGFTLIGAGELGMLLATEETVELAKIVIPIFSIVMICFSWVIQIASAILAKRGNKVFFVIAYGQLIFDAYVNFHLETYSSSIVCIALIVLLSQKDNRFKNTELLEVTPATRPKKVGYTVYKVLVGIGAIVRFYMLPGCLLFGLIIPEKASVIAILLSGLLAIPLTIGIAIGAVVILKAWATQDRLLFVNECQGNEGCLGDTEVSSEVSEECQEDSSPS